MSVVCAACHAVNRDNAMFCLGCAGKLPAFAATGPSALETVKKARPPVRRDRPRSTEPTRAAPLPFEKPIVWLSTGLLVAIVLSAFAGWYVYVTRRVPSVDPGASVEQSTPREASRLRASPAPSATASVPGPKGPASANVPLASSLSELESVVDAGAPPKAALVVPSGSPSDAASGSPGMNSAAASGPSSSSASVEAAAPSRVERSGVERRSADAESPVRAAPAPSAPTRQAAMNPMRGCEHLNFIFAARCEASHCERAEYARHPRCDAVREQRKRDEARRNPTLGF